MSVSSKPIPALYTVYVLRSTMRHASLYIGSTTDPPRRLKQHNGEIRGGAVRTSRVSLRPWEMVALVSGFPGAVAALKFEWALTNPHMSLHIPAQSRLTVSRQKKKNGHPRKPSQSLQSIVANLHLLLRVPSFARWPLRLHMFEPEVLTTWQKWCATANQPTPETLELVTDFGPQSTEPTEPKEPTEPTDTEALQSAQEERPWGIHALPLDYGTLRDYVDKARDVFTFEREGDCAICHEAMPPGQGLYAVCPNASCEAVGHLRCWSQHMLAADVDAAENGAILPMRGKCPECGGPLVWGDMMKELTLRYKAPKEVEKLVKAKRKEEKAEKTKAAAVAKKAGTKETKVTRTMKTTNSTRTKTAKTTKTATKATKKRANSRSPSPKRKSSPEVIVLQ